MEIQIKKDLWDLLSEEDKMSVFGVLFTPEIQLDSDGLPTENVNMAHLNINELDELLLKIKKIKYADRLR